MPRDSPASDAGFLFRKWEEIERRETAVAPSLPTTPASALASPSKLPNVRCFLEASVCDGATAGAIVGANARAIVLLKRWPRRNYLRASSLSARRAGSYRGAISLA